ncbi:MAG: TolC family protein [Gammaproteobacteria bacterium]|nr:TolC family protein [Gammaproteobacteria bacterium]
MQIKSLGSLSAALSLLILLSQPLVASDTIEPLPEPLTLEHALSLVETGHPALRRQIAAQARSEAELEGVEANNAPSVSIEGHARWVQPSSVYDDDDITDDHKLSLFVRKPLYDFGRTEAQRNAAAQGQLSAEQRYRWALQQRKVEVMRAYFDVVLSDLAYNRENEQLAIDFIELDRLRDRHELGQASDVQLFELESRYQATRTQFNLSQTRQRATRARLANLLDRPGMLPSTVQRPKLDYHKRELPEYEELVALALAENPQLRALQAELQAAQQQIEAARAGGSPRLDGELEASSYSRDMGSRDRVRAGVYLEFPLYTGGRIDAAVAARRADLYEIQARLDETRYALRQQVLDAWLDLQSLSLKRERAYAELDFRELYLDQSRTNYELEFKADLGDAMVRMSDAQIALARNDYEYAIAWEQLLVLTGGKLTGDEAVKPAEGEEREN